MPAIFRDRFAAFLAFVLLAASPAVFAGTYPSVDQLTGWSSCTVCAGVNANGPVAQYSLHQYVSSPSLDGASAQFWVGGSTPYADALWWRQLTPQPAAHNFQYDFWVYLVNPNAPQALEFDVNQSVNGKKYIFGTECDFKDKHVWQVWNPQAGAWTPTGIGCVPFTAYAWTHFVIELQRTSNNQLFFIDVTINGHKYYFNKTYNPIGSSVSELNVAVQLDGNYKQEDYSVWMDKVNLNYW
jgi:hypothetical protein